MFEINYTFWGDRPLTASSDKDVPPIINKLQDPNTRVLNINCLNLSEVACKQIADALKISHFLIKLSLFSQDFLTKKIAIEQQKSILEALKVNKSVQEFEPDTVHESLAYDVTEMLKVNTYLRKFNIEITRFSDENIADLMGALQNNILLDCNVYYWSSNTIKKLALEKQSKVISERNKGFVKKAVQHASSVKDIAKLPLKLLWFLKVCNQAWLKYELDGQKSKLTINYIQNTKISAVSFDELMRSLGVCKEIQAADTSKLFLPLDIIKMMFMEAYKVCLAPDFKWATDDSEVEQKIELGGEVLDVETSST